MNNARTGAKRRIHALRNEVERFDELDSALEWEQQRLDAALRGEEPARPTNFNDARAAAEARFAYIQAEDEVVSDPELSANADWAVIEGWREDADYEPPTGGDYQTPAAGSGPDLTA